MHWVFMKSRTCFYCSCSSSSIAKTNANAVQQFDSTDLFIYLCFHFPFQFCRKFGYTWIHLPQPQNKISKVKPISSYEVQLLGGKKKWLFPLENGPFLIFFFKLFCKQQVQTLVHLEHAELLWCTQIQATAEILNCYLVLPLKNSWNKSIIIHTFLFFKKSPKGQWVLTDFLILKLLLE